MDINIQCLHDGLNRAVIKFRGVYSLWAKKHNISYNEMLVLYTIREHGFCTQKQICDNYLLPKQTINNVISSMKRANLLTFSAENSKGREKTFVLTNDGRNYAAPLLSSLSDVEKRASDIIGEEKLSAITKLMSEYGNVLRSALEESAEEK